MADVACPKCGMHQTDVHPMCAHMMGKVGGDRVLAERGRGHLREVGRRGGRARVAAPGGLDSLRLAGQRGGAATRELGRGHYAEIGRRGGAVQRRRAERARAEALAGIDEGES